MFQMPNDPSTYKTTDKVSIKCDECSRIFTRHKRYFKDRTFERCNNCFLPMHECTDSCFFQYTKKCRNCQGTKVLRLFARDRLSKDGHSTWCLECFAKKVAQKKKYYEHDCEISNCASQTKYCPAHKDFHPLTDFYKSKDRVIGHTSSCKNEWLSKWKARTYDLTPEQEQVELQKFDGNCHLCFKPYGAHNRYVRPAIDHSHLTNAYRGILHGQCNLVIGHLQDNIELGIAAINYLILHNKISDQQQQNLITMLENTTKKLQDHLL